jgi:hypothetical protein
MPGGERVYGMGKLKTVRKYRLMSVFMLLATAAAGDTPTFEEVEAAYGKNPGPELETWAKQVFEPFWQQHFNGTLEKCSTHLAAMPAGKISVRLLVDTEADGPESRITDASPSPLSTCLKDELKTLAWPDMPPGSRYIPLSLNFANTPDDGQKAADKFFNDLVGGNKETVAPENKK